MGRPDPVALGLAEDVAYRAALFAALDRGQYREFRRYWAFEEERWFARHLDEVRRREELLAILAGYAEFEGARVLVVGAGFGAECVALARRGARVTALDLDAGLLAFARERARRYGVSLGCVRGDVLRAPLGTATYDWVFLRQVLEHVPRSRQRPMLERSGALVRPGGHLFVDTPNRHDPIDRHDTGLPLAHWLPRGPRAALARRVGRDVPTFEPGADGEQVAVHDFASFGEVVRALRGWRLRSGYKEFPDLEAWAAWRRRQGRAPGRVRRLVVRALDRGLGLRHVAPIRAVFQAPDRKTD